MDLLVVMPDGTHRKRTSQRLYRDIADAGVAFGRNTPGYVYGTILREGRDVYTR